VLGNVIKLGSKTRPEIKNGIRNGMGKSPVPFVFCANKEKAYSKQSGWMIRLKNC
jgi:hypothetical protein